MNSSGAISDRRSATIIGVLYIIGTVSMVLSVVVTDPLLSPTDYLAEIAANPNQLVLGALLVLTGGFALALVPVVFWPIGRRYNERLAIGYVVFRGGLEAVTYMFGALGWLLLVELSKQAASAVAVADLVQKAETVLWNQVTDLPFVIGALMFYTLLYRTRLIPRWLSGWGLLGAVLYSVPPLTSMLGADLSFLGVILAVQEMVMALWLIVKGFDVAEPQQAVGTA